MTQFDWSKASRRPPKTKRPSTAQLKLLADLGVTTPPQTSAEASAIITRRLKRKRR